MTVFFGVLIHLFYFYFTVWWQNWAVCYLLFSIFDHFWKFWGSNLEISGSTLKFFPKFILFFRNLIIFRRNQKSRSSTELNIFLNFVFFCKHTGRNFGFIVTCNETEKNEKIIFRNFCLSLSSSLRKFLQNQLFFFPKLLRSNVLASNWVSLIRSYIIFKIHKKNSIIFKKKFYLPP